MLQSEQLDTRLVLAANRQMAAGLLIQRLPVLGQGNLAGRMDRDANEDHLLAITRKKENENWPYEIELLFNGQ